MLYRDLTTLEEFAAVVELERRIWGPGYNEVVPVPILAVTVRRGGILIGAFDRVSEREASAERLVGFVYSFAGLKDGKPMQWSHMLGVIPELRNDGIGRRLKALQRERAIALGLDLIEWTFDPMQALNAHLNLTKLGVVVDEYEENVYGESQSPLHRGNPTDRFVAAWHIREPHVQRRLSAGALAVRTHEVTEAPRVNRARPLGDFHQCADVNFGVDGRRVMVEIPTGFTDMLARAPELALSWRMATRQIFTTYFSRGYKAVDFLLDRPGRVGAYLLVSAE
jgi:predicted GNAT superfamily acetyltransferase